MTTLLDVIHRVRKRQTRREDWLYITGDPADLTLNTEADLGCPEFDEEADQEIDPPGFADRGLRSTIDIDTLSDSVKWAERLAGSKDDAAALDVIRYYIRFDAWPDMLNAPDPPPPEVSFLLHAREFANKLGPENPSQKCRRDGCDRGVIRLSVFCRPHHCENIWNRPYPFED